MPFEGFIGPVVGPWCHAVDTASQAKVIRDRWRSLTHLVQAGFSRGWARTMIPQIRLCAELLLTYQNRFHIERRRTIDDGKGTLSHNLSRTTFKALAPHRGLLRYRLQYR